MNLSNELFSAPAKMLVFFTVCQKSLHLGPASATNVNFHPTDYPLHYQSVAPITWRLELLEAACFESITTVAHLVRSVACFP
jgi:hypothetical protein